MKRLPTHRVTQRWPPGCLISVRNATEATRVGQSGFPVDILDLKEPANGPLGRADATTMDEFLSTVPQQQLVSVALGELTEPGVSQAVRALDERFDYAKIGLAGARNVRDWEARWQKLLNTMPPKVSRVAVAYLDHESCESPEPTAVIAAAAKASCDVVLFDTYDKLAGSFADFVTGLDLGNLLASVRSGRMKSVLAGSIGTENLLAAAQLAPDLIGVRGAVCDHDRSSEVTLDRLFDFQLARESLAEKIS
jgi:uncharacterized protein (UPF0264 family)